MAAESRLNEHQLADTSAIQHDPGDEEKGDLTVRDEVANLTLAAPSNTGPSDGPVPNGGAQAWLQVLGSWVLFL